MAHLRCPWPSVCRWQPSPSSEDSRCATAAAADRPHNKETHSPRRKGAGKKGLSGTLRPRRTARTTLTTAKSTNKEKPLIMKPRKLRHRLAVASSLGAAAMALVLAGVGVGLAQPASAAIPGFPAFATYPSFLPGNYSVNNTDVSEGSDTTLFVMQSISDLYSQAAIYPFSCALDTNGTATNQYCATPSAYTLNTTGATAGTFSVTIAGYATVTGIPFNVSAATLQSDLTQPATTSPPFPGTGPASTTVTGPGTGPGSYVITPLPVTTVTPVVTASFSGLTGGTPTITANSDPIQSSQADTTDNFTGTQELQGTND